MTATAKNRTTPARPYDIRSYIYPARFDFRPCIEAFSAYSLSLMIKPSNGYAPPLLQTVHHYSDDLWCRCGFSENSTCTVWCKERSSIVVWKRGEIFLGSTYDAAKDLGVLFIGAYLSPACLSNLSEYFLGPNIRFLTKEPR